MITVALNEQGVLIYTIELTSKNYDYTRVFSTTATMNSAYVIFGADGCTASNVSLYRPMPEGVKLSFDWGYDNRVELTAAKENSTYTFEADAVRDGYRFLGWQVNGAGEYYNGGDTYSVGTKPVRFIAAWEEASYTEGLAFTELTDGTYSVKKGTAEAETVIIPSTYHNKPVTQIGSMAFSDAKWLKHIVLPDTITAIGGRAFHSSTLEDIVIPDGVKVIASSTFTNCASLTSVTLPSGLEDIQTDAFAKCTALQFNEAGNALYLGNEENPYIALIKAKDTSITECNIQNGCTLIYYQAFNMCTQLGAVTFPASLKFIGGQAFNGCSSLTTVVIPATVESIGGQAFGGCSGLTSITIPFIGGGKQAGSNIYAFGYIFGTSRYTGGISTSQPAPSGSTSFYYIPENLETVTVTGNSIPNGAFKNCSTITTIKLSANIKAIPANAFDACYALTDVYYDGTETEWNKVSVSSTGNAPFTAATMHYKED